MNPAPPPTPQDAGIGRSIADGVAAIRDAPRWVIVATVVGAGLLGYWIYRTYTGSNSTAAASDWQSRAVALLVERGYNKQASERAVDRYVNGGQLQPEDVSLIAVVIRALGTPDMPNGGSVPSDTTLSPDSANYLDNSNPGTTYADSQQSFWYVPVAPAGWSSSFNGIAQQFYGSTAKADVLMQTNPNLSTTAYGKLPVGAMVKVPR